MNISDYLNLPDIWQSKIISTDEITFSEDVVNACKANHCGRYGKCWTCPPGVGTLETLSQKVKSYPNAAVFTYKGLLEDSFDIDGMNAAADSARKLLLEISDRLRRDGEKLLPLGCGSCNICEKCTYPDSPCRFPEKAIVSVEACGIDVVKLSSDIGINYHNGPNTVTYFSVILF